MEGAFIILKVLWGWCLLVGRVAFIGRFTVSAPLVKARAADAHDILECAFLSGPFTAGGWFNFGNGPCGLLTFKVDANAHFYRTAIRKTLFLVFFGWMDKIT